MDIDIIVVSPITRHCVTKDEYYVHLLQYCDDPDSGATRVYRNLEFSRD